MRVGTTSQVQAQDEDLRVKVEPIQWWDVCRRTDWPEKEEFIGGATCTRLSSLETILSNSDEEDSKRQERSRWYLSRAEVQMRSRRVPVWQKSNIYFYVMAPQLCEELNDNGEVDIVTIPVREVEIRQKDLLPIFDSSRVAHPGWTDGRVFAAGRYPASSSNIGSADEKFRQDSLVAHGSSVAPANMQNLERMEPHISYPILALVNNNDGVNRLASFTGVDVLSSSLDEIMNSPSPVGPGGTVGRGVQASERVVTSDTSNPGSNRSDLTVSAGRKL